MKALIVILFIVSSLYSFGQNSCSSNIIFLYNGELIETRGNLILTNKTKNDTIKFSGSIGEVIFEKNREIIIQNYDEAVFQFYLPKGNFQDVINIRINDLEEINGRFLEIRIIKNWRKKIIILRSPKYVRKVKF